MKATPNLDFTTVKPTEPSLKSFVAMLRKVYLNLTNVINGNLGFGDGTTADNISGAWVNVIAPVAPNTDFTVNHNLNRLPVGYWVMEKDRACDVYTGSVIATKTSLTLRATVASAVLRLFVVMMLLCLLGFTAKAQTTNLTIQVTDDGGQSWNSGSWNATLVSPPGVFPFGPPFFLFGTSTPVPNQNQSGLLSGTGAATITLTQNAGILPAQSQWRFQVCSASTAVNNCFTQFATVTATTTLTITPPALIVNATAITLAYSDGEVSAGRGALYFNLVTGLTRQCATATGTVCTLWQTFGGGSGGATLQTNNVTNATQNVLNLLNGTNIGIIADAFGGVTIANTAPLQATCPPSGGQGTVQAANGSGGCQATQVTEQSGTFAVNESLEVKGLNPHVDATRYGVMALASLNAIPAISGITSTTTAGLATVTVSTASCPAQTGSVCFVNGNGVVLPNAGNSHSLTTPSAPTVTPFNSRWGTGTGDGVAAPASSTSYNYKLFAFDLLRGRTAVSSVGTTTTGAATLGEVTYTITGGTKSNDTITFTGATQPAISVGALAIVDTPTQAGDNCYLGYWKVSTVTGTGFTVAGVGMDTRNPMPANCLTTSSGGFTAHFFNYNQVTWTGITGAYNYGVCSDRASPGTYHLLGTALYATDLVHALNTYGTLEFDDFGSTMTDANHVAPWEFSDSDCNAVAATNDDWQAIIQSGAGTTTLTMTTTAPNSNGGGQPIRFDNSPTYAAARTAVGGNIAIMLPLSTGQYVFNSPLDLRASAEIMSAPQGFTTNAVVYFLGGALYCNSPTPGSGSSAPGANKSIPVITTLGLPGIQVGNFSYYQNSCRITAPNNGTAVQADIVSADNGISLWDSQFASGSTSNDYLGKGFVCHNSPGTALNCIASFYGKTNISGGVQSMGSHSATPSVICDGCGVFYFTDLTGFGRTIGIRARANTAAIAIKNQEFQGPSMPLLLFGGQQGAGNGGAAIVLGSTAPVIIDTSNWGCASYIPSVGTSSFSFITLGGCTPVGTGTLQFTGSRMTGPGIISPNATISGQNRDGQQMLTGGAVDNIFTGPAAGLSTYSAQKSDLAILTDTSYPIFVNGGTPATPTCSVSAGGSVSIANHRYQLVPVWWNVAEGTTSLPSIACTTSSGNQTVTINWTPPGTPLGYNLYQDNIRIHNASGVGVSCSTPQITPGSTNSIVLTQDGNCGIPGPSAVPSGGPTMFMPGLQGMTAPVDIITQYIDILETSPPANPAPGLERVYTNNTTHQLSCLLPSGASCNTTGGTPAPPACSVQFNNSGVFGAIPCPTSPDNVQKILSSASVGGVPTTPSFKLPGVTPRDTVCPSNLDTILAGDRAGLVRWNDASACAVTLPQAGTGAGTNNDFTSNFVFLACDIGAGTATVTPTTSTITYLSGGVVHSAQTTMPVTTSQCAFTYSDNTNYFAVIISAAGVTSFTGDSLVYSNSGSTGPVTLTLNTQLANKVFANCTGSTAAPTFCSIVNAMLPGTGATTVNGQTCTLGSTCTLPPGTITVANAGTTGTTVNTLTKLTGAPSTAVITATTDTTGVIGITTSGAGTTGSAVIQLLGSVSCVFDGATIAGDYVQISSTTVGDCHDTNSATYPAVGTGDVIGRVLSTNGAAGTYVIDLFPQEVATTQTLSNGVVATTQTAGDNTTKVATDAFVTTAVNNAIAAVNPAVAVLAATTGSNLTGTYSNGASGIGATFTITATGAFTLDGVAINTIGQRVLLKDQTSAFQNGTYTATIVGTTGVSAVFTRALDYDQPSDINTTGAIPVQSGTVNASTSWLLTSTVNTVGTDALTYVQFSIAPSNICSPGSFVAQTDAATVTWAIASKFCANASLTFTVHSGSRTLNITNPVNGGSYVIWLKQDGTGGEGLTLGTGCTWKVSSGGAGAITPSTGANAIDVLAFTYDGTNCYANFNKNFN